MTSARHIRGGLVLAALLLTPAVAEAAGGTLSPLANLPIEGAVDVELHGDRAYVGSLTEGLVIVDVSDPRRPKRQGTFECGGGGDVEKDVEVARDGSFALLSLDSTGSTCHPDGEGTVVVDVSDPRAPRELAWIPTAAGTHTQTLDGNLLYVNNPGAAHHRLEIFDLAEPARPRKLAEIDYGAGRTSAHDSFIDHRPDGRVLLYSASLFGRGHVFDVTRPEAPVLLQEVIDPTVSVFHQAQPDARRRVLVVGDEGLTGSAACGQTPAAQLGAIHLYPLSPDGTVEGAGARKLGTFNVPFTAGRYCTSHFFEVAPSSSRLLVAWFGHGVRLVDFTDPSRPTAIASFAPEDADTFVARAHRGLVFTADLARGLDVLSYGGEGWPARRPEAGQGPSAARDGGRGPSRGAAWIRRHVDVPPPPGGRRPTVLVKVRGADGRTIARMRRAARVGRWVVRARISAAPGVYRYAISSGGRRLATGRLRILATG